MSVHSADSNVTLQQLLVMMMMMMILLLHHSDARPLSDCCAVSTADKRQRHSVPSTYDVTSQQLQHHLDTKDDKATWKTATIQQVPQNFAICRRPFVRLRSVVCNVRAPTQLVEIFGNVSMPFGTWPSDDIHRKFYGDHPRETPLSAWGVKRKRDSRI